MRSVRKGVKPKPLMTMEPYERKKSVFVGKRAEKKDGKVTYEGDDGSDADEEGPEEDEVQARVLESLPELVPVEVAVSAGRSFLKDSLLRHDELLRVEEPRSGWRGGNDEEEDDADEDGQGGADQERNAPSFHCSAFDAAAAVEEESADCRGAGIVSTR
jgi:hypothetical protein